MLFTAALVPRTESAMEIDEQKLTERERQYLEHVRHTKERGISLTEYCAALGIKPRALYSTRRDMVRKGMLPRVRPSSLDGRDTRRKKAPSKFAAVRVTSGSASSRGDGAVLCRVRHPSGCVLELGQWPEAAWMSEVLEGRSDASA